MMASTSSDYTPGFAFDQKKYSYIAEPGLSAKKIKTISSLKDEPDWMLKIRLKAFDQFQALPLPDWGPDLSQLDFEKIYYYLQPTDQEVESWDEVPDEVKQTFERLKVPQAEREVLAGLKAQYDSEVVYGSLREQLAKQGVVFESMDKALHHHPDLVKQYFGQIIASNENKFTALNTAVWSGGSFIYVPPGVELKRPLQTYFRINSPSAGQFERTLIIIDEGAKAHYVEGCTAPSFSGGSLHAGVVEVFVKEQARCQYSTIQNWYKNVYNLVTKRARVEAKGEMVWTDFNMGSKVTMKYPACVLAGRKARGETLTMALVGEDQHIDAGAKMIHLAPETSSNIISKSISTDGGRSSYWGKVKVSRQAKGSKSNVVCDALLLDDISRSDTYPVNDVDTNQVQLQHEATVSKIGQEQLFYLMSRGLSEETAQKMIVNGFIGDLVKKLPLEYAVEMNRLIEFEMEGSVG
jgi:Fe-S cluster assembly protein SufB